MTTTFRTFDLTMRRARRDKLVSAAGAGVVAGDGIGYDVLITGSLARGQVHPWSDLDLLLVPRSNAEGNADYYSTILRAVEAAGIWHVDIVPVGAVQPGLRTGMVDGARALSDIAELADLPDPDLAPLRAAQSLEFACQRARKTIEDESQLPSDVDPKVAETIRRTTPRMIRSQLSYKASLALKRLAVFQDGGQSSFLDGDTSELTVRALLDRLLIASSTSPIERPAMLIERVKAPLLWLLEETIDDYDADISQQVGEAVAALETWIPYLRSTTSKTETHGLQLEDPAPRL